MDEFAASVLQAERAVSTLEVSPEEISTWLSRHVTPSSPAPGVTHYPGSGPHAERYLRFRRDLAFTEAYLARAHQHATMWTILPTSQPVDPINGTHNVTTLRSNSAGTAYEPCLGDIAAIELGAFFGHEDEVLPIIQILAACGSMIWIQQVDLPDGRLLPSWFHDTFAYVSAVRDGDLFRPGHPDIDA